MKLSKTNFLAWRECAHDAWFKMHRPDLYNATPLSDFERSVIAAGNEVDLLARELFAGGVTLARGAAEETADLVQARAPVLYQPVFETDRFTTACDILVWNEQTETYDLYEVKASTGGDDKKAKNELYTWDIAVQAEVLRQNGVPVGRLHLVRLDGAYVRGDTLDLDRLFTREDFTDAVEAIRDSVAFEMDTAYDQLQMDVQPEGPCGCIFKGRNAHCRTFAISNPDVPAYSVHDITRIGAAKKKLADLVQAGILSITDVPEDLKLSPKQANQVRAAKTGQAKIEREEIAAFLDAIRYPVSFLDYETFAAAIPRFRGFSPFAHIPFQFSLDIVPGPGADFVHKEFLHPAPDNPDRPFLAALREALPGSGSIIVWNQSFERGINDKLAERNPSDAEWLADIDARIVDLMEVFDAQAYVHPGFRGRTSIKSVLPVLVPGFSYKDLAIQEGGTASARWNEVVTGRVGPDEAERISADLLAYCGLDSRAMVEIWRALLPEAEPVRRTG
jgi:hypothetical protein